MRAMTPRPTAPNSEEAARKPGARQFADEWRYRSGVEGAPTRSITGENIICRNLAHASMEPPVATANSRTAKVEVWAPVYRAPAARVKIWRRRSTSPSRMSPSTSNVAGRQAFGRKSKCDFALEAAFAVARRSVHRSRCKWTRREDEFRHDFHSHRLGGRIEAGLGQERQGDRVAATAVRRRPFFQPSCPNTVHEFPLNLAWDSWICRSRSPTFAARKSGSCSPYPHRLVPFGFEHSATALRCNRWSAELAQATGRDPKDMLLELIGEPRIVKLKRFSEGILELRRAAG